MTTIAAATDWVRQSPYAILFFLALLPLFGAAVSMHEAEETSRHRHVAFFLGCFVAMLLFTVVLLCLDITPADLFASEHGYRRGKFRFILYLLLWGAVGQLIAKGMLWLFHRLCDRRADGENEEDS